MSFIIPTIHQPCDSLVDVLDYWAASEPDFPIYQFLSENNSNPQIITYHQLSEKSKAIASTLKQKGLEKGDRAILIYEPGIDLISAYFGCLSAGIIAVPVYPPLTAYLVEKLQRVIENCDAKILLTSTAIQQKLQQLKMFKKIMNAPVIQSVVKKYWSKKLELTEWDIEKLAWLTTDNIELSQADSYEKITLSSNDLAFLQYTSGSTSHPKGVMISHGNLLDNLSLLHSVTGVNKESVGVNWLPPYHDMGLIGTILLPFFVGFTSVLFSPLTFLRNPKRWLQAITDYHGTTTAAPNFAYDYCVKKINDEEKKLDLSSWEVAINGAEPIHVETLERFYQKFKSVGFRREALFPCYGLAEATLFVSGSGYLKGYQTENFSEEALQKNQVAVAKENAAKKTLVSLGQPKQPVFIVNPETHTLCVENEIGEIWIEGASVAKGYWQQNDVTNEIFHAKINGEGNYLRTGDLGFLYQQQLYVTGRIKDLIIIHGANYYPQDIEHTVSLSHAAVRIGAAAAFSSDISGEEKLIIVTEIEKENYADVAASIAQAIVEEHEIPVYCIVFIAKRTLPKTTSGKLRRRYTKQLFDEKKLNVLFEWKQSQDLDEAMSSNPIEKELQEMLNELMQRKVGVHTHLAELGIDSLLATQMLSRIRDKYEVELPIQNLFECKTIHDLAKVIARNRTDG